MSSGFGLSRSIRRRISANRARGTCARRALVNSLDGSVGTFAVAETQPGHLWGDFEGGVYRPGGRGEVAQLTPQLKVGVLICFDLEQAPAAEDLARRGAQMILAISATWAGYKVVPEAVVPTRAYVLAFVHRPGDEGKRPWRRRAGNWSA